MSPLNTFRVALNKSPSNIINSLRSEIKLASKQIKNSKNALTNHFMRECRKYQTTDERTCNRKNEMQFLAETYLTYLESSRKYKEISSQYAGKGERNIAETANLVGFKLPHDPK